MGQNAKNIKVDLRQYIDLVPTQRGSCEKADGSASRASAKKVMTVATESVKVGLLLTNLEEPRRLQIWPCYIASKTQQMLSRASATEQLPATKPT